MDSLFTYSSLRRKVFEMKELFPFAEFDVAGRSWAGRAVFGMRLGNQNETAAFIGCVDGRGVASTRLLLRLFENMCKAYKDNKKIAGIRLNDILDERGILVLPCVNPDGAEIVAVGETAAGNYADVVRHTCGDCRDWQANARGVDLNHNISSDWKAVKDMELNCGYTSFGSKYFGGKIPLSEPETKAVAKALALNNSRTLMQVDCGIERLYVPRRSAENYDVGMMAKVLCLSTGYELYGGAVGLAEQRGFVDWFSSEYSAPSFSLGLSFDCEKSYHLLEEGLVLFAIM